MKGFGDHYKSKRKRNKKDTESQVHIINQAIHFHARNKGEVLNIYLIKAVIMTFF